MTSSQSDITVNGLNLTVYGLLEYKRLPQSTPVAVLFALHGRLRKYETNHLPVTHSPSPHRNQVNDGDDLSSPLYSQQ